MAVDSPRQNKHGWWGTLTIDPNTDSKDQLEVGERCIFIKTKREAHYVTQGTVIKKVHIFEDLGDAFKSLEFYFKDNPAILEDLKEITKQYPEIKKYVEILRIDYQRTTPLARKLNIYTLMLFALDHEWLEANAEAIGKEDVELGLSLPPMEEPGGVTA